MAFALDVRGYRDFKVGRFPDRAEALLHGETIKRKDINKYFTTGYYWALGVYSKIDKFGFPNCQEWGNELNVIVRIWEIFSNELSSYESEQIEGIKNKSATKQERLDLGNHRRTNTGNSRS